MKTSQIKELASYQKLIRLRRKVIWGMSIILVLALFFNLYLMSYGSELGATTIGEGAVFTVLVAYSISVILIGALSAIFYVWWANRHLDPLIKQVNHDIQKGI